MVKVLSPQALRRVCDPKAFDFETTATLPDLQEVLGQPRAVAALEFGVGMASHGFNLFALDDGPVVKSVPLLGGETDVHVDFPIVLITRPANPSLGVEAVAGERNPWATPLARGTPGHLLRVGAFAPDGIDSVVFTIDGGAAQTMTPMGGCFQAVFETPVAASCTIEVTATAAGRTAVDRVELELAAR